MTARAYVIYPLIGAGNKRRAGTRGKINDDNDKIDRIKKMKIYAYGARISKGGITV